MYTYAQPVARCLISQAETKLSQRLPVDDLISFGSSLSFSFPPF